MFFQTLRSMKQLCDHPDDRLFLDIDHVLKCHECDFSLSIPFYLVHVVDPTDSLRQAEEYVKWSGGRGGNLTLPCVINLRPIQKRLTSNQAKTSFDHVADSLRLLKIIQDPLSSNKDPQLSESDRDFFRNFVKNVFDTAIRRNIVDSEDDDDADDRAIGTIVRSILELLKSIATDIDRYLEVVVPYVKRVGHMYSIDKDLEEAAAAAELSASRTFQKRMVLAFRIDRQLSPKSAAFDAMQVAVLCCLLRHDRGTLVQDLVLDFAGRLCRGFYDAPCRSFDGESVLKSTEDVLNQHVSLENNTEYYRHLQLLREGGVRLAKHFSHRFFLTHWTLEWALSQYNHHHQDGGDEQQQQQQHFDCAFPRILFTDYSDYFAFWAAISHYGNAMGIESKTIGDVMSGRIDTSSAKPILLWECKAIYRFVKNVLARIKTFHEFFVEEKVQELRKSVDPAEDWLLFRDEDRKIETTYVWSVDMLKLFINFDPEFAKDLSDAVMKLPMLFSKKRPNPEWSNVPLFNVKVKEYFV